MEILMQPNQNILAIIGEQPVFANKDYRFMKYCIMKDYPEGKLIFNGLTRTAVLLSPDEINEIGNNMIAKIIVTYLIEKLIKIEIQPKDTVVFKIPLKLNISCPKT